MKKTENKKTNLEIYLVGGYILRLFLQPEAQKELTCPQVRPLMVSSFSDRFAIDFSIS
jgi:hypothetical protein